MTLPGSARVRAGGPGWDLEGPSDAPLLVFIHGTRVTRASWRAVIARLADSYRCLSLDLPGHGDLADVAFSLDSAVNSVGAAIGAANATAGDSPLHGARDGRGGGRGAGRAILVGLSLGGYVAMAMAGRDPTRVRGLVLAGCTAEPGGRAAAAFRLFGWALATLPQAPLDAVNSWLFRRRYAPEIAEPIIAAGYWSRGGAEAIRAIAATTFRQRLEAFGGPALVVNGDLDFVFRIGERSFIRGLPRTRRVTLAWTSHLSPLDRPDRFADEVRAFERELRA